MTPKFRWWNAAWKFPRMVDVLQPARVGSAEITHFEVTPEEAEANGYARCELWLPGTYCELEIDTVGWMWDIPDEWLKNRDVVEHARGDVLIVGLGMGMILHPILAKPDVQRVHVVELNPDVRDLVLPSLANVQGREKLTVEIADGLEWESRDKFDCIWLDAVVCASPEAWWLKLVEKWINRYQRFRRDGAMYSSPRSWIGHWAYYEMLDVLLGNRDWKGQSLPLSSKMAKQLKEWAQ